MADVVDITTRSRMMAGIQGKNTTPEMTVRRLLHRAGFRYRLHDKNLPGRPDLVLPRYRALILINGCFWHHHNCHLFKWPSTRPEFWREKIESNQRRDQKNLLAYRERGWRVMIIWECTLKGKTKISEDALLGSMSKWLKSESELLEVSGDLFY